METTSIGRRSQNFPRYSRDWRPNIAVFATSRLETECRSNAGYPLKSQPMCSLCSSTLVPSTVFRNFRLHQRTTSAPRTKAACSCNSQSRGAHESIVNAVHCDTVCIQRHPKMKTRTLCLFLWLSASLGRSADFAIQNESEFQKL